MRNLEIKANDDGREARTGYLAVREETWGWRAHLGAGGGALPKTGLWETRQEICRVLGGEQSEFPLPRAREKRGQSATPLSPSRMALNRTPRLSEPGPHAIRRARGHPAREDQMR